MSKQVAIAGDYCDTPAYRVHSISSMYHDLLTYHWLVSQAKLQIKMQPPPFIYQSD